MTDSDEHRWLVRPDVDTRAMADGSCLLVDPTGGANHAINATAAFVWQRCDGAHTPAQIAAELQEVFEAPPEGVQHDVERIIAQFTELGLLTPE